MAIFVLKISKMFKKTTFIALITGISLNLNAQTIQFLFCGKTESIPTLDAGGKDQRLKAAFKLDFLKIGLRGSSQTAPFYVLGNVQGSATNENFVDKVLADNCSGSSGSTGNCSQCGICTNAVSTTAANLGTATGKFLNNVRVESKGNDMYIMCTGVNNVVCYETHKISLAGQAKKAIDVYYKYEGIALLDPVHMKNISLTYRYNNDNYPSTPYFFNKNSMNVGVFEDVGSIFTSVPNATEDLSRKLNFNISPNPVHELLKMNMTVYQEFNGFINILNEKGAIAYYEPTNFAPSETTKEINISNFISGNYVLHVSDEDGRVSTLRFVKL